MKLKSISLEQLISHPKRDNHTPPEVLEKIKRHMERTGQTEAVSVYQDPYSPKGVFTILNGHTRVDIAKALGWSKIDCYILDFAPADAELALATLNTLKGTPDPQKRMDLLASLAEQFSVEELGSLLPESQAMLEDLLKLQALEQEAQEQALQDALEAEIQSLPVMVTFVVSLEGKAVLDQALSQYPHLDAGEALVAICQMQLKEVNHV